MPLKSTFAAAVLCLIPLGASADVLELSQRQLRQLVQQQQVLRSETIATTAVSSFGGEVIDIRAFLSVGRMTYRLLLQRDDGAVVELLYNGTDGRRVSHQSEMGEAVSSEARSNYGSTRRSPNGNANGNGTSGNNGNGNSGNGNSGNNGNGNSGNGNSGNGNSGNNGNKGN